MEYKEKFISKAYFVKVIVICSFYSASAIVYLIPPTCTLAECELYLMTYVNKINSKTVYEDETAGRPVSTISLTKPFTGIAGYHARAFTAKSEKIKIQHFKNCENATGLYFYAGLELTDIEDARRCKVLPNDRFYFNRQCVMIIYY